MYIYIYIMRSPCFIEDDLLQGKFESCILTQMWISVITCPWILVSCKKQIWVSAYHSLIAVRASKLERGLKTSPNTPQICGYIIFILAYIYIYVYTYFLFVYIYICMGISPLKGSRWNLFDSRLVKLLVDFVGEDFVTPNWNV